MKNTLRNKAKFFAQYFGQDIFKMDYSLQSRYLSGYNLQVMDGGSFLELKPLSQITDEDAIKVAKVLKYNNCKIRRIATAIYIKPDNFINEEIKIDFVTCEIDLLDTSEVLRRKLPTPSYFIQEAIDLLRLRGYALPWLDISVEEQIKFGWIKLKE